MKRLTHLRLLAVIAAFLCAGAPPPTRAVRLRERVAAAAATWPRSATITSITTDSGGTTNTLTAAAPAPLSSLRRWRRSARDATPDPYGNNIRAFQMLGHFARNLNRRKHRNQQQGRPSSEGSGSSDEGAGSRAPSPPRPMEFRSVTPPRARSRHLVATEVLRPLALSGGGGGGGGSGGGGGLGDMQPLALRAPDEDDNDKRTPAVDSGSWASAPATSRPDTPRRHRVQHFQPELLMMAPPGGPGVSSAERERLLNGFAFTSTHWGPLGRKRDEGWLEEREQPSRWKRSPDHSSRWRSV